MGPEAVVDIPLWVETWSARLVLVFLHVDDTIPSVGHHLVHAWQMSQAQQAVMQSCAFMRQRTCHTWSSAMQAGRPSCLAT